jgi:DNA-binding response OmpR family regulator
VYCCLWVKEPLYPWDYFLLKMTNKNTKIVLCEDELIISLDLKRILKKHGYTVTAVYKTAEDVLKNISKDKPDIVIADVNLNGNMNGLDLAEILVPQHAIKVMFLTGSPITNYKNKLRDLGCDFIMKPFDEKTLTEKLIKNLSESPSDLK